MMKKTVAASLLCDLSEELQGRHAGRIRVGARRDLLVLSSATPVRGNTGTIRGEVRLFTIHHWKNGEIHAVLLPPTDQIYFFTQQLGSDYICVDSRCTKEEKNAHVFSSEGIALQSWSAGDAVQDVQVTLDNQVWISYFDEGVLCGGKLSRQGLNCFDSYGEHTFGFHDAPRGNFKVKEIADCYALNVASNRDTWLCYYQKFPRVHLRDLKVIDVFDPPPEMIGSHSFAVKGPQFLFTGGYHHREQVFWRDEAQKEQIELEVVDENLKPLNCRHSHGRGADLFFIDGPKVWMLSLTDTHF